MSGGRTALGNIPSHLKGAINHSLFIKSPARPGEKCQEHKSPPPLACKGSRLAKGCEAGSEPPTIPREGTARPRCIRPHRQGLGGQGPDNQIQFVQTLPKTEGKAERGWFSPKHPSCGAAAQLRVASTLSWGREPLLTPPQTPPQTPSPCSEPARSP